MPDTLLLSVVAGIVCVSLIGKRAHSLAKDETCKRRILASGIRTCVAILFPLILSYASKRSVCAPAILWVTGIHLLDSFLLWNVESVDSIKPASLKMEPTALTSLTFALCGYMGAKADHKHGDLFLFAIMACLLCVLPSHSMKPGCLEEQVFESVQKSLLFNCVGLLVAGVCLVRGESKMTSTISS